MHGDDKGAFTGEVSAAMLVEAGCTHVIVGHSERRQYFGETDASVNARLRGALRAGLDPDRLRRRDPRRARGRRRRCRSSSARSAAGSPAGSDDLPSRACSPTSRCGRSAPAAPPRPAQAQEVHLAIRKLVAELVGQPVADSLRILYGGSVKPDNIDALMAEPDIDGALVGGASLDAVAFARIVKFQESR